MAKSTTPVWGRPKTDWNTFTDSAVAGPYIPSIATLGIEEYTVAMVSSCYCICLTLSPLEPIVRFVPGNDAGIPEIISAVLMYMLLP